jgi:hypothetical protein
VKYKFKVLESDHSPESLEDQLNEAGLQGFHLVAVIPPFASGEYDGYMHGKVILQQDATEPEMTVTVYGEENVQELASFQQGRIDRKRVETFEIPVD